MKGPYCLREDHATISDCLASLEFDISDQELALESTQMDALQTCMFRRVKVYIVRLRRERSADWPFFKREVEGNIDLLCRALNTRWLISIMDTYADYGDSIERRDAMLVSLMVTWEKLAQTYLNAIEVSVSNEQVEKMKDTRFVIWDGIDTMMLGRGADVHRNLFGRLSRILEKSPVIRQVFKAVVSRLLEHEATLLSRLDDLHARELRREIRQILKN
jgi:hypothetical protein